ncbi:MAG: hypothetical protein LBD73_01260, partial [Deferribacteraceae bacterium]|nr:hypothetical protein [Deferribacteraceae bacterium]
MLKNLSKKRSFYRYIGASAEFQNFILDFILEEKGYRHLSGEFKIKSGIMPRQLDVVNIFNDKKTQMFADEKQVVFYSEKYAKRAKA